MSLWHLELQDSNTHCDYLLSLVVRAETELDARRLANGVCGTEGTIWQDATRVTCHQLTADGFEQVIMTDYEQV